MENLVIQKTIMTPEVTFGIDGKWLIKGVSNGNNVTKFYEGVGNWLDIFKTTKPSQINLTLEMEYMNTSSALAFVRILRTLYALKLEGCQLKIVWRYEEEDEDLLDLGQHLSLATKCEFEYSVINKP
jgi:hypothetical protein